MEQENDQVIVHIDDDEPSSTNSHNSIDLPFRMGRTNTKSVVYWTQVAVTATVIGIGSSFAAAGIVPIGTFMPLVTGVVFYWMPAPSIS